MTSQPESFLLRSSWKLLIHWVALLPQDCFLSTARHWSMRASQCTGPIPTSRTTRPSSQLHRQHWLPLRHLLWLPHTSLVLLSCLLLFLLWCLLDSRRVSLQDSLRDSPVRILPVPPRSRRWPPLSLAPVGLPLDNLVVSRVDNPPASLLLRCLLDSRRVSLQDSLPPRHRPTATCCLEGFWRRETKEFSLPPGAAG